MLSVTCIMNSSIEEVLAFKCCTLPDQNLEILLHNGGAAPLVVLSHFTLEGGGRETRITAVYPPGGIRIPPGETAAMYTSMDEALWERMETIRFEDESGRSYRFPTSNG